MSEQDVIGHLIDVERLAYDLLLEAQTEADKRKAAAKEAAELEYRSLCQAISAESETACNRAKLETDEARTKEYANFTSFLENTRIDRTSFDAYLDSVFSGQ